MALQTQYSETYIANIALAELGASEITDIETDISKGGRLARLWYPVARDSVIAAYPWSIARTRYKAVPANGVAPLWKWTHAHAVPSETLRVLDTNFTQWDVEGRTVVAFNTPINLFTLDRVTNVAIYPPIMITALAKWLVSLLSIPITSEPERKTLAIQEFRAILEQAKTVDSYAGSFELFRNDELVAARDSEHFDRHHDPTEFGP